MNRQAARKMFRSASTEIVPQDVLLEGGQPGPYVRVLDGGVELLVEEDKELLDVLVVADQGLPDAGLGVGFLGQLDLEVAEDPQQLGGILEGVGQLQVFLVVAAQELVGEAPDGIAEHELLGGELVLPEQVGQRAFRDDVDQADVFDEVPELVLALDLVQVEGVDRPAVGEVLDVFSLGEEAVGIDDVRDVGKEARAGVGLGHDRDPDLLVLGDGRHVDERALPTLGLLEEALVSVDGVLRDRGQEGPVRDLLHVRFVGKDLVRSILGLVNDIHPQVLEPPGLAQGPIGLEPVVGIPVLDALLDLDARRLVLFDEVEGLVLVLRLEVDLDDLLPAQGGQDLGGPEGFDVAGDGLDGGRPEVEIAHAQAGAEGVQFLPDCGFGIKTVVQDEFFYFFKLLFGQNRDFGDLFQGFHGTLLFRQKIMRHYSTVNRLFRSPSFAT